MKKFILTAAAAANLWMLASWLNTILTNCATGDAAAVWNLFRLIYG